LSSFLDTVLLSLCILVYILCVVPCLDAHSQGLCAFPASKCQKRLPIG
jgi:hypothetical protein